MNLKKIIRFSLNHSVTTVLITVLLTLFMAYQTTKIKIDTDPNSLMPQSNHRIDRIKKNLSIKSETNNFIFLAIEGEDLFSPPIIKTYYDVIQDILKSDEVDSAITPFNFINFDSKGKRITPSTITKPNKIPQTEEEIKRFKSRLINNSLAQNFVVASEGRVFTTIFTTNYSHNPEKFMAEFQKKIAPLEQVSKVYYSGENAIGSRVGFYLEKDFSKLLILAIGVMLSIFFISFRSRRAVFLPVAVVSMGAIWSLGFMALLGFKLTIVSVIIPSLILTIGSSYTIHVLNEYFRCKKSSQITLIDWLSNTIDHVTKTVILAALTTVISFISLLNTTMTPLKEFGIAISFGILTCALLSLFFLPSIFLLIGPPQEHHRKRVTKGILTKMVLYLGHFVIKHKYKTLLLFFLLLISYFFISPQIKHQSDYISYFPSEDRLVEDTLFIIKESGGSQSFNITLQAPNDQKGYFLDPKVLKQIDQFERSLKSSGKITQIISFTAIIKNMNQIASGKNEIPSNKGLINLLGRYFNMIPPEKISLGDGLSLINKEQNKMTIFIKVGDPKNGGFLNEDDISQFKTFIEKQLNQFIPKEQKVDFWGNTLLLLDASKTINRDQKTSTILSIILGLIITAIFFKSITFSFMAIIPLLSGIFCYFITLYIFKIPLDMTTILVTNVTVGVGLDDAVHFIFQYRHQRKHFPYKMALHNTLKITGQPIVLTTLSLVAGLMVLCFASFTPIRYFGLLISGSLFSTMVGTVVFLPAIISIYESFHYRK